MNIKHRAKVALASAGLALILGWGLPASAADGLI